MAVVPAAMLPTATTDDDDTVSAADLSLHDLAQLRHSVFRWTAQRPSGLTALAHVRPLLCFATFLLFQSVYLRKHKTGRFTVIKCFSAADANRAEHELEFLLSLPKQSQHFAQLLRGREQPQGGFWIELEYIPAVSRKYLATTLAAMQLYTRTLLEVRTIWL